MYLLYAFVQEFSEKITREIDARFSPTSGNSNSEDVKRMMEETKEAILERNRLANAVNKLGESLQDLQTIQQHN